MAALDALSRTSGPLDPDYTLRIPVLRVVSLRQVSSPDPNVISFRIRRRPAFWALLAFARVCGWLGVELAVEWT